ncbi:MAG: sulfite exporter TauE/SafE family protein [Chthoniobacteraceae bacterium]
MMQGAIAALCGSLFGIAFGLTGVGSIFAVPLLVYALGLPPHQAVCVSMVAVNVLALVSSVQRLKAHEVVVSDGLRLAIPGLLGAPLGAWIGTFLAGHTLMIVFGIFVGVLAVQMLFIGEPKQSAGADAQRPQLRSIMLIAAGMSTGLLAGLLGAGGVLIVPSLVLLGGLAIHRAIATSLPVIYAISVAAISSHLLGGQTIPLIVAAWFVAGAGVGLFAGRALGQRLSGPHLQRVFAFALLAVATFILARTVV